MPHWLRVGLRGWGRNLSAPSEPALAIGPAPGVRGTVCKNLQSPGSSAGPRPVPAMQGVSSHPPETRCTRGLLALRFRAKLKAWYILLPDLGVRIHEDEATASWPTERLMTSTCAAWTLHQETLLFDHMQAQRRPVQPTSRVDFVRLMRKECALYCITSNYCLVKNLQVFGTCLWIGSTCKIALVRLCPCATKY